jgi:hypothetical protein
LKTINFNQMKQRITIFQQFRMKIINNTTL